VEKVGSLIEYFKKKTAENVLEKAIKHAQKVQDCVRKLDKGIETLLEKRDIEKSHDIFHKVDLLEGESDTLRREILADISKGELNPSVRLDLSHLIKRLDDVANCANGVARRIVTIPEFFWEQTSAKSIELIIEMMKITVECGEYLDKLVFDLLGERKNLKEYSKQVNILEHKVDLLNIELRGSLQETEYDVNAFTIFTVGNTIDILEAISDSMEVVADYIMLLMRSASASSL
jgi:predicted phosphate transport protein (TIGR00153 family)